MKRLNEITFLRGEPDRWNDMTIKHAVANYKFRELGDAIGIDPGINWGLTMLVDGIMFTYWGTLPKMNAPDRHNYICRFITAWFPPKCPANIVMIEGAAYGAKYSREALEDSRLGFYDAFKELGKTVSYAPPLTIRKEVFGKGTIKGNQVFLDINENSADSVAICLYASGYKFKE